MRKRNTPAIASTSVGGLEHVVTFLSAMTEHKLRTHIRGWGHRTALIAAQRVHHQTTLSNRRVCVRRRRLESRQPAFSENSHAHFPSHPGVLRGMLDRMPDRFLGLRPTAGPSGGCGCYPNTTTESVRISVRIGNGRRTGTSPNSELDRAEHLRLAIEHLTAAGLHELAGRLDRELLIEAKLEQIRKLQAEVDALRGVAKSTQILLQLKIVELQRSEMRKRGFDFSAKPNALADAGGTMLITKQELDKLVESLQKDKLAKVLAEPTLVTVSGRPACFQSGGEIPIIVPQSSGTMTTEYRQTGTRVDCVGTVMENGQVRLELSSTVSEVDAHRKAFC